ncbi:MAG: hypothetical protein ACRDH2_19570, partial [Anaerolineales bacterium]
MPESLQALKPQVIVLYNENPDWPEADLTWSRMMLDMMLTGLREEGYDYQPLRFFDDLSVLDRFDPREWLIWNWGEELAGQPWSEAAVAAELERRGFAFTGSPSRVIAELQNRFLTKERLRAAGLPTLSARVFRDLAQAAEWQTYPAIVKGNTQHASYGISGDSVAYSPEELGRRIAYLRQHFDDDALVEPFLDSREFQV